MTHEGNLIAENGKTYDFTEITGNLRISPESLKTIKAPAF